MAANILTKSNMKQIFYAPSMRSIVAKLNLLTRSMTSMTMKNKYGETSMSPVSSNWPQEPNFPLPGNIAVDVNNLEVNTDTQSTAPKYQNLASALFQLENETFRKHQVLSQFIAERFEEDDDFDMVSFQDDNNRVECGIQSCPSTLKKDLQKLFSNIPDMENDFTIITISQKTQNDMATWSEEVEKERDMLTGVFIDSAKSMCQKIKDGGYWADFIDPSSGHAFYSEHRNETFTETDDRFNQLGFEVEDLGCCKVLLHKQWKSNVFVGIVFTNAPVESHVFDEM